MPWIGVHEGDKKAPRQVPTGEDVECPTCKSRMRVWRRSSDGKARHFKHIDNMGHGEGGGASGPCDSVAESDIHKKWKSLAADRLEQEFNENILSCEMEKELAAPESGNDRRIGDAVVVFKRPDPVLGQGVVIEVQHKNESKDIEATTADYIAQNFAVVWADEDDFADDRCRLVEADFRHRAFQAAWPDHAPNLSERWFPEHNHRMKQRNWQRAKDTGEFSCEVPARLPKEWNDDKAMEIWRSQNWNSLFTPSDVPQYQLQGVSMPGTRQSLETKLPPDFVSSVARQIYRSTDWSDLFTRETNPLNHARYEWVVKSDVWEPSKEVPATISLNYWLEVSEEIIRIKPPDRLDTSRIFQQRFVSNNLPKKRIDEISNKSSKLIGGTDFSNWVFRQAPATPDVPEDWPLFWEKNVRTLALIPEELEDEYQESCRYSYHTQNNEESLCETIPDVFVASEVSYDDLDGRIPDRLEIAKQRLPDACPTEDHDWVETIAYWKECRKCGLSNELLRQLGQQIK